MTSKEIYTDIKENNSQKSYPFLKNQFLNFIKINFTKGCESSAEDFFTNAYIKLMEKIKHEKLSNYSNIKGYFMIICRNDFISDYKRNRVQYSSPIIESFEEELIENETNSMEELKFITAELLEQLPRQLKLISTKLYIEGKDHKEIAHELNINYNNVRKYQYKALKFLKTRIPANYAEYLYAA
jgi:RNA polymerase sigma factor (sigma-70 family)